MNNIIKLGFFLLLIIALFYFMVKNCDIKNYTYGPPLKKNGWPILDPNIGGPLMYIDKEKNQKKEDEEKLFYGFKSSLRSNQVVDPQIALKYLKERAVLVKRPYFPIDHDSIDKQKKEYLIRKRKLDSLIFKIEKNKEYHNSEILEFIE